MLRSLPPIMGGIGAEPGVVSVFTSLGYDPLDSSRV